MKRNIKGFTLVELLAVIVILGIIGLITFPIVSNSILNSKKKAYNIQVSSLEESARKWAIDNLSKLDKSGINNITVAELIKQGFLTKTDNGKIINPLDNKEMNGCVLIEFDEEYNQYIYKYDEECKISSTIGQVVLEKFPNLVDGSNACKTNDNNYVI